jgi:hypothetical protein
VELDAPGNFWAVEFPPGDWPSSRGEARGTLHQLHDVVEGQLGKIGEAIRQQMLLSRDQVLKETRQELRGLAAEMRQQLSQESTPYTEAGAKIDAQLDEVRNFRDYLESLLRLLPETLDQRLEKGVAAAADRLQARMEEEIAARTPANVWLACSRALPKLEEKLWANLQKRLEADFDRRRTQLEQLVKSSKMEREVGAHSDRQTLARALEAAHEKLTRLEGQVEMLVTDLRTEVNWVVAEACLRSLAIYEEVLGPEHPTLAQALENYAVLLHKMGREVEAQKTEARAKAIRAQQA